MNEATRGVLAVTAIVAVILSAIIFAESIKGVRSQLKDVSAAVEKLSPESKADAGIFCRRRAGHQHAKQCCPDVCCKEKAIEIIQGTDEKKNARADDACECGVWCECCGCLNGKVRR